MKYQKVTELIGKIAVFQKHEYEDKILSFYDNLQLNYQYIWKICRPEKYMKILYRRVLQENGILFLCNRCLDGFVKTAFRKPEHSMEYGEEFFSTMEDAPLDKAVKAWKEWTGYRYPEDPAVCQSRYGDNFEQWWRIPHPLIGEW